MLAAPESDGLACFLGQDKRDIAQGLERLHMECELLVRVAGYIAQLLVVSIFSHTHGKHHHPFVSGQDERMREGMVLEKIPMEAFAW